MIELEKSARCAFAHLAQGATHEKLRWDQEELLFLTFAVLRATGTRTEGSMGTATDRPSTIRGTPPIRSEDGTRDSCRSVTQQAGEVPRCGGRAEMQIGAEEPIPPNLGTLAQHLAAGIRECSNEMHCLLPLREHGLEAAVNATYPAG